MFNFVAIATVAIVVLATAGLRQNAKMTEVKRPEMTVVMIKKVAKKETSVKKLYRANRRVIRIINKYGIETEEARRAYYAAVENLQMFHEFRGNRIIELYFNDAVLSFNCEAYIALLEKEEARIAA